MGEYQTTISIEDVEIEMRYKFAAGDISKIELKVNDEWHDSDFMFDVLKPLCDDHFSNIEKAINSFAKGIGIPPSFLGWSGVGRKNNNG